MQAGFGSRYDAPMPKLSLSMIVRNEAATLGRCLASARDLVDEIIVVDTGSSDGTQALAASFGARIGQFPWADDFAAARNESLRLCTGDWILILDADEAVDAQDHASIRESLHQSEVPAFRVTLRNYLKSGSLTTVGSPAVPNRSAYTQGREFSHYSDFQGLRLCRRLPGLAFRGRIHELLDPYFEERGLTIGPHPAVIHHFGKLFPDREAEKRIYYLSLAREEANHHPEDFQGQFNLLLQALTAEDWATALEASRICLSLRQAVPALVLLGHAIALQQLGDPEAALPFLDRLLAAEPAHAAALVRKAISLAVLGRLEPARARFRDAIRAQPGFLLSYLNLADLERQVGNLPAARAALEEGLAEAPGDPALLEALVLLSLHAQDFPQAASDSTRALERLPRGGGGLWHRLAALGALQMGIPQEAARFVAQGLQCFPKDPELESLRTKLS